MRDPVAVYDGANNVDAAIVSSMLQSHGIESFNVDDVSQVGTSMLGLLTGIHKPQVWVERPDAERARQLIEEHKLRRTAPNQPQDASTTIGVTCEDCQKKTAFPMSEIGSVGVCSYCGAYVDVGDDVGFEWE